MSSSTQARYRYDPGQFREVFEHHFGYLAGVRRNSLRFASRPALHEPVSGRRWTYAQLWEDTGRLAAGLHRHGVGAEDVIVFSLLNGPEFALTWLAALRLGAIAAPINFRLAAGEVAHVLDDSRPEVLILDSTLAAVGADALSLSAHRPELVVGVDHEDWSRPLAVAGLADPALPFGELFADIGAELPSAPHRNDLCRDHAALHLRHHRPAQGRLAPRRRGGALRPRRDHAFPAHTRGPNAQHDPVVPPRRPLFRRTEPDLLRRRRGGPDADLRRRDRARLGAGASAHLSDRRPDQPLAAQRRAAQAARATSRACTGS